MIKVVSLLLSKYRNALWVFIPVLAFSFLLPQFSSADDIFVVTAPVAQQYSSDSLSLQQTETPQKTATFQIQGSSPAPQFNAKSVLVYDPFSDLNLYEKNQNEELPIASLTKLMTAVVATESPDFDKPITITPGDVVSVSPSLHLRVGDSVRPEDLVKAMLVGSANDAAQALANHFPNQQEFINVMNQKAENLGMKNTHYTTPIGFDTPGNYSTAADLKVLVDYSLNHLPYSEIWQNKNYYFVSMTGHEYSVANSNDLIHNHGNILSIKTGFTNEALGNMIVLAHDGNGRQVISLVLNSGQRENDTLTAVDYVFKGLVWPGN